VRICWRSAASRALKRQVFANDTKNCWSLLMPSIDAITK